MTLKLKNTLIQIYERDLERLKDEIKLYKKESNLWIVEGRIKNSGGNLCLHIVGNLRYFVGSVLGQTGYKRNRAAEFSEKNISRETLIDLINKTKEEIIGILGKLNEEILSSIYPENIFNEIITTEFFLIHLLTHLNYHLGQINYHRRLIDL